MLCAKSWSRVAEDKRGQFAVDGIKPAFLSLKRLCGWERHSCYVKPKLKGIAGNRLLETLLPPHPLQNPLYATLICYWHNSIQKKWNEFGLIFLSKELHLHCKRTYIQQTLFGKQQNQRQQKRNSKATAPSWLETTISAVSLTVESETWFPPSKPDLAIELAGSAAACARNFQNPNQNLF